ncbi:CBS domain-containing protein [Streptomyces sp. NPDC046465]|uniref:CBS domain-containing protein n=1 Tax=Streptomyces sp. NPDC046465 TaxID=3155810 RepID=UPI0033E694DF
MAPDDTLVESGPQVWADMTVEVALCVMAGARVDHLLVCNEDGKRTDLVTWNRLSAVRDSSVYTDRIRLRDISDGGGGSNGSCGSGGSSSEQSEGLALVH